MEDVCLVAGQAQQRLAHRVVLHADGAVSLSQRPLVFHVALVVVVLECLVVVLHLAKPHLRADFPVDVDAEDHSELGAHSYGSVSSMTSASR